MDDIEVGRTRHEAINAIDSLREAVAQEQPAFTVKKLNGRVRRAMRGYIDARLDRAAVTYRTEHPEKFVESEGNSNSR